MLHWLRHPFLFSARSLDYASRSDGLCAAEFRFFHSFITSDSTSNERGQLLLTFRRTPLPRIGWYCWRVVEVAFQITTAMLRSLKTLPTF